MMIRPVIHMLLHFAVPGLIARLFISDRWQKAWFMMVLTMIIDLDHLLAQPVYDPDRCGIGFHPLHSYLALGVYAMLTAFVRTRVVGVGLLIHMALDGIDCIWMFAENR